MTSDDLVTLEDDKMVEIEEMAIPYRDTRRWPDKGLIDVGKRIALARKKKRKINQKQLSEELGKSRGTIVQYELGMISPPLAMIQKLAEVLREQPEWLAFGVRREKKPEEGTQAKTTLKIEVEIPIQLDSYSEVLEIQPRLEQRLAGALRDAATTLGQTE